MTPDDLTKLQALFHESLRDAENFNKLYIGIGTIIGVFVGMLVQFCIAWLQMRTQKGIAAGNMALQRGVVTDQLAMQEETSKRIARDNINTKRQAWIDNLREDIAEYMTLWEQVYQLFLGTATASMFEVRPWAEKRDELVNRADLLTVRIQLRLNPTEFKHKRFVRLMRLLEGRAQDFSQGMPERKLQRGQLAIALVKKRMLRQAQIILKAEWVRIKHDAANPKPLSEE